MGDLFDRAIIFATQSHAGVCRKGSTLPYIIHPLEVAAIAATITEDDEILAAAVLHDVLEDTAVTRTEMRALFGERVANLVAAESENKRAHIDKSLTWYTRKQETIDHLAEASRDEQILTLADKLSNLRALARDEAILGEVLWQRFNQKDRAAHGWYYREIAKNLTRVFDTAAYEEFATLVRQMFGSDSIGE